MTKNKKRRKPGRRVLEKYTESKDFSQEKFTGFCEEYKGVMATTIKRFFPGGIATTKKGVLDFDDLMHQARMSLWRALARFEEPNKKRKSSSFKSYLILCLRSDMMTIYSRRPKNVSSHAGLKALPGEDPQSENLNGDIEVVAFPEERIPDKKNLLEECQYDYYLEMVKTIVKKAKHLKGPEYYWILRRLIAEDNIEGIKNYLKKKRIFLSSSQTKGKVKELRQNIFQGLKSMAKETPLCDYLSKIERIFT